ncbi:MAG: hypothetical protein AAF065_05985 [Verrucomicrobiota bacterium]
MFRTLLIALFTGFGVVHAQAPEVNLSFESAKAAIDQSKANMEIGSGEIQPIPGVELLDLGLSLEEPEEPLFDIDLQTNRGEQTIAASIKEVEEALAPISESYESSRHLESLKEVLEAEQKAIDKGWLKAPSDQHRVITIGLFLEFALTLAVLAITFQISAYSPATWQLVLMSLGVAFIGGLFDYTLNTDLQNPIRSIPGFVMLIFLVKRMTFVRTWTTAAWIAILSRGISMALAWLAMSGIMTVFSL